MDRLKKYFKYICYLSIGILLILKSCIRDIDWIDAISYTVTLTSLIMSSYITYFWKYNPLEDYPRLGKKYEGIIKTDGYGERTVEVEIIHNLLYTYLKLKTDESVSKSKAFNIFKDGEDWKLIYSYLNEPKILERSHSGIHYGTCVLEISNKNNILGSYYTDRKTVGEIELTIK